MSIIMKKVKWKNFLSTGNIFTEILLNKHKTTSISGENGSGKTTLLDAIIFALFGRPYRNINIPQLPNSINKKDCLVELHFDIGSNSYIVRRGLVPKIFEIYQNGKLIDQDSTSKDYQRMFEEHILRMNYKSFCQVVILGSTNYIPFMRLSAAERRSVVENLLDINIFSTMNIALKAKIANYKEILFQIERDMDVLKEKIDLQTNHVNFLKERKDKFFEEKTNERKNIQVSCVLLEEKIENIQKDTLLLVEKVSNYENISNQFNNLQYNLSELEKKQNKEEKQLKGITKLTSCPICTQTVNLEVKNKLILEKNIEIQEIESSIQEIQSNIQELKIKLKEIESISKQLKILQNEQTELYTNLKTNKKLIETIDKDLENYVDGSVHLEQAEAKITSFINQGKKHLEKKQELVNDLHYCNIASVLLKDSGIKSKIIKHYLPIMNKVINRYLSEMNFFVQFELDEEFKEIIKSRNRDVFSYENFSEGEKRKIDLALLFAWRKISQVKNSLNCNLLIFDEILDGSLDDGATKLLLNILQIMDKGSNIFVISHKSKDILQDKFENNITFTKKKNFSRASQD